MKTLINMKLKTLLLVLTIFTSASYMAQGNLQFNKALAIYTIFNTQNITVPAGKTWKLTAASTQESVPGNYFSYIVFDGVKIYKTRDGTTNTGETTSSTHDFPIWLAAGTYYYYTRSSSNTTSVTGRISGIEFNIIP